jgi:hypothetical protein
MLLNSAECRTDEQGMSNEEAWREFISLFEMYHFESLVVF